MPLSYNQIVTINNSLYRPYYIETIIIIKAYVCGMTSSNGNIFRVTGPLWENPPVTGDPPKLQRLYRLSLGLDKYLHRHTSLGMRLFIHAGIKLIHGDEMAPVQSLSVK